jgi:membrane fusion protein, multidrug efflux system
MVEMVDQTSKSRIFWLSAIIGLSMVLAGCKGETKPSAELPQPVRVMTVAYQPLTASRSYTGVVKPRFESDLGFRVAGKVVERLVDVGAKVAEGDVIARLDATDYRFALETQEAELRAATSSRDQAVAAEGRYRDLLAKGHVSTAALEQRAAAAEEARQRVEKATRAIATARNQVGYTDLKADAAGVVAALPVEAGQVVAAGQTVARIARAGETEVAVAIPEQQLGELQGAAASVEIWANGAQRYDAILREVSPEADPASRTYQARYTLKARDAKVALGMTATVVLQTGSDARVARLPLPAVLNDGRGPAVFVVDTSGGHIVRTPVTVVSLGREEVIVGAGLQDGQRVVTLGTHLLDEARPVKVVETLPGAATIARATSVVR